MRFGLLFCLAALLAAELPSQSDRLSVLFLGDRGHHQPAARAAQVHAELARRGIDLFYTNDVADLRADKLRHYDAVMIYANHTALPRAREADLLAFIAGGKGLVAIHCASYCFLRSPRYVELVGAQFKSHGAGTFREKIVAGDHPITRGLEPIESWDETYVHHRHNADRLVLAVRPGDSGDEPYTWVRRHGAGRVFYTAWGHDQRTWGNEQFGELLVRGTRWACKRDTTREPAKPPFTTREAKVPEYRPGRGQGTLPTMQSPLAPGRAKQRIVVPPDFEVSLFAAEPDIVKPIAMAWDTRGRLWIAETYDYPNEMQAEGKGRDRIKICEDTDRDGKADRFTVFADKLSIPTSLTFARGGVIVAQAPHMLFLRDADGDDVADERKVLFSGWGTGDTHAGPSNLRYGFDNQIWGAVGYSGFRGTVGGEQLGFGQGFYRFTSDGARLEYTAPTTNNTWGMAFGETGLVFGSTANGNPSVFAAIPNRSYEAIEGASPRRLATIAETLDFHPILPNVRQVDWHGKFTAAAGHALYTARAFPRHYWNRGAFVCGPTGHLLGQLFLEPNGSHFVARDGWNLLASDDEWFAPIAAEVGPDGAVWVIDWYNFIVQHNPTPHGFKRGRGNAYVTPLRDKRHGRIYRVTAKGSRARAKSLHGATPAQLVAGLRDDNMLWRMHAQRLLVERGNRDVVPALLGILAKPQVDSIGLDVGAIHALWTLHGLGAVDGRNADATAAAIAALRHASAGTRRNALQVIPRDAAALAAILDRGLLGDSDAHVRLAALLALSESAGPSTRAGEAVFRALQQRTNRNDHWIPDAAMAAAARHAPGFLSAALKALSAPAGAEPRRATNLIANPSFEDGSGAAPHHWRVRHYGGKATQQWVAGGRTGARALRIASASGADSSWHARIDVEPRTRYALTGWVKTHNVATTGGGRGAQFNVHEIQGRDNARTKAITGTCDWTRLRIEFDSGDRQFVTINCLFGGWGWATGTAWFDDLELCETRQALPGRLGRIVSQVTRHYASQAPAETVIATLSGLRAASAPVAAAFLDGLASGWPQGRGPELSAANRATLAQVLQSLPGAVRPRLLALARRWGETDVFGAAADDVREDLSATVADADALAANRVQAASQLVELFDDSASIAVVLDAISLRTDPALAASLVNALASSRREETGAAILGNWSRLSPKSQAAAVATLASRPLWTRALLDAIAVMKVARASVPPQRWLQLERHPDAAIATLAKKLRGTAVSATRQKVVDALIGSADRKGDAANGAKLYAAHCAVCHAIGGKGGAVGPPLDGIGARPRREILVDILDPNRSVEANFQLWVAQTDAGSVVAGRLDVESKTSVELLDLVGKRHIIQRKRLKSLQASPVSLMPAAFESLGEQGLADLLEYLAQTK